MCHYFSIILTSASGDFFCTAIAVSSSSTSIASFSNLYASNLDIKTGEFKEHNQALNIQNDKFVALSRPFQVIRSVDSSKVLFVCAYPVKNQDNATVSVKVTDNTLKELWKQDIIFDKMNKDFSVLEYLVDNKGNIHISASVRMDNDEKRDAGAKGRYYVAIYSYFHETGELKEYEIGFQEEIIMTSHLELNDKDELICTGFYTEITMFDSGMKGFYYLRIDPNSKEVVAKNTSLDKKETGSNSSMEAPKETGLRMPVNKDTTIQVKAVKDSASNYINQASLPINNIKGIEPSKNSAVVTEIKMNGIGKDTSIVTKPITLVNASYPTPTNDTITKVIVKNVSVTKADTLNIYKKPTSIYPDKAFKINQVAVIWAKAGTSLLQIATEHNIPLYKVFVFNDLKETDLLAQDQLLFLGNKKAEGDKSFHLVVAGESLYDISQKQGVQLKKLKEYNPGISSETPATGIQLILVKPKEQKIKLSLKK